MRYTGVAPIASLWQNILIGITYMLDNFKKFDTAKTVHDPTDNAEYSAVGSFDIYGETYYICPIEICGSIIVRVINV
jgi:hypothetical protein